MKRLIAKGSIKGKKKQIQTPILAAGAIKNTVYLLEIDKLMAQVEELHRLGQCKGGLMYGCPFCSCSNGET